MEFLKKMMLIGLLLTMSINAANVSRMICRVSDQYAYIEFSNVSSYQENIKYGIFDAKQGRYISWHTHSINHGWVNFLSTWNKRIPKHKIAEDRWLVVKINGRTKTKRCK